jgi:hypothetical protein|tara:strand:+ start:169 stop:1152 length:984 start_codon:yes stop_codon:yes gene_type:complete
MQEDMMLKDNEIRSAFALLMGRTNLPQPLVERHRNFADIEALGLHLMRTDTFRQRLAARDNRALAAPADMDRPVTVFQHVPKAGGTSLHTALTAALDVPLFPERRNGLGNWPAAMLAQAQFFSGHFDSATLALIPGRAVRVVTMLRDPTARLVSLYRYLRSVDPNTARAQKRNMNLIRLARAHDAEAFFAHPDLVAHPSIDNAQTRQMAGALGLKSWESHPAPDGARPLAEDATALPRACAHLKAISGVALLEHPATIPPLFTALGLTPPPALPHDNITDENTGTWFSPAPPLEVTDKIRLALKPHIEIDTQFYYAALQMLTERGCV